jgi:hypothetical protein
LSTERIICSGNENIISPFTLEEEDESLQGASERTGAEEPEEGDGAGLLGDAESGATAAKSLMRTHSENSFSKSRVSMKERSGEVGDGLDHPGASSS